MPFTRSRYLPPSKLLDCQVTESYWEGCILKNLPNSAFSFGVRSRRIEAGCGLIFTYGAHQPFAEQFNGENGSIPLGIGANTIIRRAIVDKNAIGCDVQIINKDRVEATKSGLLHP